MRYTFEIDKNTEDFVKKIEYVIGAIKNDIATRLQVGRYDTKN